MKDIRFDGAGDLYVDAQGDIEIVDSPAQEARIRLRWFLNEWRFNRALGIPYFEEVFVKRPDLGRIKQLITEQLRAVDGITAVISVDVSPDQDRKSVV